MSSSSFCFFFIGVLSGMRKLRLFLFIIFVFFVSFHCLVVYWHTQKVLIIFVCPGSTCSLCQMKRDDFNNFPISIFDPLSFLLVPFERGAQNSLPLCRPRFHWRKKSSSSCDSHLTDGKLNARFCRSDCAKCHAGRRSGHIHIINWIILTADIWYQLPSDGVPITIECRTCFHYYAHLSLSANAKYLHTCRRCFASTWLAGRTQIYSPS